MKPGPKPRDPVVRLMEKIDVRGPDDCWPWLGPLKDTGYGQFGWDGRNRNLPNAVYTLLVGEIPEGQHPDHTCHNDDWTCPGGKECKHRACANPSHLELVSHGENISRMHKHRARRREALLGVAS